MNKPIIIAIDGVSGSGKSTMARTLAAKYNFMYVDTGAMYRAVTLYAIEKGYLTKDTLLKKQLIDDLPDIDIFTKCQSDTYSYFHFFLHKKRPPLGVAGVKI